MQPSTQVTHIPDEGVIDPSVLFLVKVAAEVFTLEYNIFLSPFSGAVDLLVRGRGMPLRGANGSPVEASVLLYC